MPKGGRRRTEEESLPCCFHRRSVEGSRRRSGRRRSLLKERRGCKPSQDTFSRLYTCSREEGPRPTIFDVSVQWQCARGESTVLCACVQSRNWTVPDPLAMRCCCFVPRRRRSLSVLCPATYAGVFFFSLLPAHPIIQSGRRQSGPLCLQCLLGRADVSNDVLLRGRRTCCCKVHV